jgi:sRNA-binding regulator protein Hfq
LADVKNREPNPQAERSSERHRDGGSSSRESSSRGGSSGGGAPMHQSRPPQHSGSSASAAAAQGRKRIPPAETNAEIFYYKKQMDAHTQMVIVLQDGEEVVGTIEWYDRAALKVNRKGEPNVLLLKHNIKYMFKAEDRDGGDEADEDDDAE